MSRGRHCLSLTMDPLETNAPQLPPSYEPIDSRKLLFFYMVACCGSIGEAARRLYLTRSALSHALRNLELELDCELFHRSERKVTLTSAGERFVPIARRILEAMDSARSSLLREGVGPATV